MFLMKGGAPINRHLMVILKDGTTAVDWGDEQFLDVLTGKFIHCTEKDISHPITNEELDQLKLTGLILSFDHSQVYFARLPERKIQTLD
jgi:hypothetical protein